MNPIPLVAFLLLKDEKVLMEVRKKGSFGEGETWTLGGHVEPGETPEQAFFRETKEELNVVPLDYRPLLTLPWSRDGKEHIIHYYVCFTWEGEIVNKESAHLIWIPIKTMAKITDVNGRAFKKLLDEI